MDFVARWTRCAPFRTVAVCLVGAFLTGCAGESPTEPTTPGPPPQRIASWTACYDTATSRNIPVQREASPQLAVLSDGSVLAVWIQCDGARSNVWTRTFRTATGWSLPRAIGSGEDDRWPAVAVNAKDDATVLWYAAGQVWETRHAQATGFGSARPVPLGQFETPAVYMREDGDAVAVWPLRSPVVSTIRASRRMAGEWTSAEMLDIGPGDLSLASTADASANLTVAWSNDSASLWTARLGFGSSWSGAERLEAARALEPRVSGNPQGDVSLVFRQSNSSAVMARHRPAGGAWGPSTKLNNEDPALSPQVDLGGQGGVAAWATQNFIWADRQSSSGAWGPPQMIGTGREPLVVADDQGNSAAVWVVSTPNDLLRFDVARLSAGGVWSAAEPARPASSAPQLGRPALVIAAGFVHVVWAEQAQPHGASDTVELWSARLPVR